MDQKEKLVGLLVKAMGERAYRPLIEGIADDLIANGVVVLPCKPGDRVRHLGWDHEFVVNTVELGHKAGTLFRCGNPGTEDYTSFYEDEIGVIASVGSQHDGKCHWVNIPSNTLSMSKVNKSGYLTKECVSCPHWSHGEVTGCTYYSIMACKPFADKHARWVASEDGEWPMDDFNTEE